MLLGDMEGRRVVQRLVNGETALEIARSFGYRSAQPVMDKVRDFIVAKLGAERYLALPVSWAWATCESPERSVKRLWRRIEPSYGRSWAASLPL